MKKSTKCKLYPVSILFFTEVSGSFDKYNINMCERFRSEHFDASDIDSSDFFFIDIYDGHAFLLPTESILLSFKNAFSHMEYSVG